MKASITALKLFSVTAVVALVALPLQAQTTQNIFWAGGTGTLLDANYNTASNATTGLTPTETDVVAIIASSTVPENRICSPPIARTLSGDRQHVNQHGQPKAHSCARRAAKRLSTDGKKVSADACR